MLDSTKKILGARGEAFLEGRGISLETADRFGIYTAARRADNVLPAANGDILVFPYYESGAVVNEKYRAINRKMFWQWTKPRQTFYNAEVLDDAQLAHGAEPLVICEGEIDCLTAAQCGFIAVSVPNGAPAKPVDGDRIEEAQGKYEFAFNNRDKLKKIQRFVLATDADGPGRVLMEDLVRRLGPGRCYFVEYQKGCKDLNDVLVKHGAEAVVDIVTKANEWPVSGLHRLRDYRDVPEIKTFKTGWPLLDNQLLLWPGEFMVVTGIPGHGKTSFTLNLLMNLAKLHGWRAALFSPEMPVVPFMRNRLRSLYGSIDKQETDNFLDDHFIIIGSNPAKAEVIEQFSLEWILEMAETAVWRYDIRVLLVDPWNEIEHVRRRDEMMTDYVGRAIVSMKRFAATFGVAVIVVAHPTKMIVQNNGKPRDVTLYDIEGSSHWMNKPDHGLVINCPKTETSQSLIRVAKVRLDGTGEKGAVLMHFDRATGSYAPLQKYGDEDGRG